MRREAVADTFLGHGVAIPHGMIEDRAMVRQIGLAILQVARRRRLERGPDRPPRRRHRRPVRRPYRHPAPLDRPHAGRGRARRPGAHHRRPRDRRRPHQRAGGERRRRAGGRPCRALRLDLRLSERPACAAGRALDRHRAAHPRGPARPPRRSRRPIRAISSPCFASVSSRAIRSSSPPRARALGKRSRA